MKKRRKLGRPRKEPKTNVITKKRGVKGKGKRFVPILERVRRLKEKKKMLVEKPRVQDRHLNKINGEYNDSVVVAVFDFIVRGGNEEHLPQILGVKPKVYEEWKDKHKILRLMIHRARKMLPLPNTERYRHLTPTQRRFLMAYEQIGALYKAAKACKINMCNHYGWIGDDPTRHSEDYIKAFELAKKISNSRIEAEIHRRAVTGLRKYKFHNGKPIFIATTEDDPEGIRLEDKDGNVCFKKHYYEIEYSDTLLIFEAKKRMPEYRDKSQVDVKHEGTLLMELVEKSETKRTEVIDAEYVKQHVNQETAKRLQDHTQGEILDAEIGEAATAGQVD